MLAVFHESVAKGPAGLKSPGGNGAGEGKKSMLEHFSSANAGVVALNLGTHASMAYTSEKQNPLLPRLFAVMDDVFCIFEGHIENVAILKQQYGLSKTANEVIIIIEAYRTLRDRGPYPADQVVRDIHGKFAFILFDSSAKSTFIATTSGYKEKKKILKERRIILPTFLQCRKLGVPAIQVVLNCLVLDSADTVVQLSMLTQDADGNVPFFWGTDLEGNLVFSGDADIVKKGCGNSYAPFPKGCFFTTSKGLQSYEHPLNELKPIARVDSQGQVCGSNYKVDEETKKETGIPRVGSAADWSAHY